MDASAAMEREPEELEEPEPMLEDLPGEQQEWPEWALVPYEDPAGFEPRWPPPECPGAWHAAMQAMIHLRRQATPCCFAEAFAGNAAVSRGVAALGYPSVGLDMEYHPEHDVLTPAGFLNLLGLALDVVEGGVLWAAPPCSTWVWLSRSSTGRNKAPEGKRLCRRVVAHNALLERLVFVLEVCVLRGVHFIVEQPRATVMWDYPAMQDFLQRHCVPSVGLDMGAYGAECVKATTLKTSAPYLWALERRCDAALRQALKREGVATTTAWTDGQGQRKCQGSAELKGTQVYPEGFGAAHGLAFQAFFGPPRLPVAGPPQTTADKALQLQLLFAQLPTAVQTAARNAWWLRDFFGEPW